MRLRNIPGADAAITESVYCITKAIGRRFFRHSSRFTLRSVWERAAS